jgi:RND family efflux transporter MFP subunit
LLALALSAGLACTEAPGEAASAEAAAPPAAPEPSGERVMPVDTHRAVLDTVPARISASGSIRARRVTAIGSEVGGRLVEVFVEMGDPVEAGEALFRIDPVPYELALAEVRAGLALAMAESDNAVQEARRMGKLVRQDAVSEQRHDQLLTQAAVAGARVAEMEARVGQAKRDLERTTVRAPYAGSIVERLSHEGAMAGPEPILVLQESGALEAVLDIPAAAPAPVQPGARVRLFAEGRADPIETRVSRVSARIEANTRTYEIRCPVEDASGMIKAGSYVRAEVLPERGEPRPVVHRSALVARDGRTFVFLVNGDTAEQVAVRVGVVGHDRAEILDGVAEGDLIVRGPAASRLTGGERVAAAGELDTAAAPPESAP